MHTWAYTLRRGHSANPAGGACAMDAVNWLVHGRHGDQPACACPVIGAYVIALNDAMPNDQRQRLIPYLHRIAGSRSDAHEQIRAQIFARGAVRVLAPLALDAAGLRGEAAKLRSLPADVPTREAEAEAEAAARAAEAAAEAARRPAKAVVAMSAAAMAGWAAARAARSATEAAAASSAAEAAQAAAAAAEAARAARAARWAARAARWAAGAPRWAAEAAWDAALALLAEALSAGPQGEPWSADVGEAGLRAYREAGGLVTCHD